MLLDNAYQARGAVFNSPAVVVGEFLLAYKYRELVTLRRGGQASFCDVALPRFVVVSTLCDIAFPQCVVMLNHILTAFL
jgi:hypothetical protein